MRYTLSFYITIIAILFSITGCKKKDTEPEALRSNTAKMGGLRDWVMISSGSISELDSNEVRHIVSYYNDTTATVLDIKVIDENSIIFRGTRLKTDVIDEVNREISFKIDPDYKTATYLIDISLRYFIDADSISVKQDSTFFVDPNTLLLHTK
jgi:hypothetical protein